MTSAKILKRIFIGLGLFLLTLFIILWLVFDRQINNEFKESVPYEMSVEYIKNDHEAKMLIGDNLSFGRSIGGHLSPNKEARLVFKVKGGESSVRAVCIVEYVSGNWDIQSITYD